MSLEKIQTRRAEIENALNQRQKEIADLQAQVTTAEATIRQWTDLLLIQRGQLIELDNQITELTPSPDEATADEESDAKAK